ncbi:Lsr2 family protein [Pseudonocardia sp. C8]|uniref:histone-like nucleoid-structuring protein Lsr2 n=1 Tax=Pseudonocardia sp. C8 TaxID=2762759 RepID=UPI0016424F4B|nr:Lsr2 family protein [Pseudonocardia sp. C8]
MAKIQTVRLVDDLTGDEAVETVPFAVDGTHFEIELSAANATALRESLAPFVAAARDISSRPGHRGRHGPRSSGGTASSTATRERNQAVRAWARQNGFTVSERGRIPGEVVAAYQSANQSHAPTQDTAPQFSG